MYLEHFGLQGPPFALTPHGPLFFAGAERQETLNRVNAAIAAEEGFIEVSGAAGSGKTVLCRILCQQLAPRHRLALLLNPNLPAEELLPALLNEFRLPVPPRHEKLAAHLLLRDHLSQTRLQGQRALLLIEDAHCMPLATLEELRLLGNLETDQSKLLQVVLFAQPALEKKLQNSAATSFQELITTRLTLPPLTVQETGIYLNLRLRAAGYPHDRLFSPLAVRCIHAAARGRVRRIHLLAHQGLQNAHAASVRRVTAGHILRAITRETPAQFLFDGYRPLLASGAVAALVLAGILFQGNGMPAPHTQTTRRLPADPPPVQV
ncbi:MAG: AAA family ATPase, partial [Magnetococcales bacterium]|nr:AAA family ATPase [Magnetococcales bacterium]